MSFFERAWLQMKGTAPPGGGGLAVQPARFFSNLKPRPPPSTSFKGWLDSGYIFCFGGSNDGPPKKREERD